MKRGMDSSFDTWRVNGTTIISRESNWGGGRRRGGVVSWGKFGKVCIARMHVQMRV